MKIFDMSPIPAGTMLIIDVIVFIGLSIYIRINRK